MPPSFHFDENSVLDPIPGDSPAGAPLQFSDLSDEVREARREDDAGLQRGVWTRPLKQADWHAVERLCLDGLRKVSKDPQLAVSLTEAWLRLHGFAGLREGLRLSTALVGRFGDAIFASSEPDEIERRLSPLEWLDDKLSIALKFVPLTDPPTGGVNPYPFAAWEKSGRENGKAAVKEQANLEQSVLLTATDAFLVLYGDIEGCLEALATLRTALEARLGAEAPSLRQLASSLEAVRGLVAGILQQRDVEVDADPGDAPPRPPPVPFEAEPDAESAVLHSRPIRSRDEAYRLLSEAADYLARTEPHSPTPYLVRRAILWGSLRLEDLLPELVRNDGELKEIFRLLQIAPPGR